MPDTAFFTSGSLFSTDYLGEAITRTAEYAAIDAAGLRLRLRAIVDGVPRSDRTNEAQTEDDVIWPVLAELGWTDVLRQQNLSATGRMDVPDGILFADAAAKARANAEPEEWRRYGHGAALVESKRWARPLDRASGRDELTAPSSQMIRYLRRTAALPDRALLWGILTNGGRWRLYRAGGLNVSEAFVEIDLARVLALDGDDLFATRSARDHWLRVFAALFARDAFRPTGADGRTFHGRARADAAFYEERVAASLSALVFDQVFPDLATAIARAAPDAALQDVREATLVLLYRLLFLLYAEDRDLLPVGDSRYTDYALRPLRLDTGRRVSERDVFSTSAGAVWNRVADLSAIIDRGDAAIGVPPYNGGLFGADSAPLLARVRIPDSVMAPTLDALSYERSTGERRYINYRDLSVQQLGSIYERLLEHELVVEGDGALTVRPNPFARKNTGSYYTPDALVGLILTETLEPLITDRLDAFAAALSGLNPRDAQDYRRRTLRAVDPASAILGLRVCDPAMGSGHFLVSLVDALADRVLDAMAEAAAQAGELAYTSPLADTIEDIRTTILCNARDGGWTIDPGALDDRHIVRRMVLKRCVFGVDKNPMAVELAKVALWLHTFTVGAPLSFLDHHLRAGDSLFGLWVRDAVDRATALGGGLLYAEALAAAQHQAQPMAAIERATDADITEAHRSAELWEEVEAATGPLDGFVSFLHALDWLRPDKAEIALVRLWLDGRFGEPIPIAQGRAAPGGPAKAEEVAAFTELWTRARALIAEERFLNWQIAFPGVWTDWGSAERHGGFDAVVGNPPWDRIKLQQVEWFAARRPAIALAARASDRKRMIAALERAGDPLFADYAHADARAADTLRVARSGGHYPLLGRGDLNLYSLFVERAHALVRPGGMVGLLTPSGIASDLSASAFFRQVATGGHLKALYDFENRRTRYGAESFFPDVDSRFKFAAMIASPTRTFEAARCGFFLQAVAEIDDPDRAFPMAAEDFARVNPNTGTAPIFRSRRDMALTTALYERLPVLVDRGGDRPVAAWPVRYNRMFDMTNDSHRFRTRAELETDEGAWHTGGNRWQSPAGDWVPLYEGKMVQAFDHRAASVVVNPANVNRPAQPVAATEAQHASAAWTADPQFWIQPPEGLARSPYTLAFKDVTAPTNVRSMIAAIVPSGAAGNTLPLLSLPDADGHEDAAGLALLAANLNSVAFDFVARQKIQGQHLNWFIVEQLPVVPPAAYDRRFGGRTAGEIVRDAVLELTHTAYDMAPFARDLGWVDDAGQVRPPFPWDEERRLHLRAKLDALYFILTGVVDPADPAPGRDDVAYIFSTFPIVEREETARWGRHRSRDLTLAWINALLAGQPDADIRD